MASCECSTPGYRKQSQGRAPILRRMSSWSKPFSSQSCRWRQGNFPREWPFLIIMKSVCTVLHLLHKQGLQSASNTHTHIRTHARMHVDKHTPHTHTHSHTHTHTHRCGTHRALNGCQYKEEAANKKHFVESLAQTGSAQQQKHPSTIPLFLTNM